VVTVFEYCGLLLVLSGFVVGFVGMYRTFVLHKLWWDEKGTRMVLDGWLAQDVSEEFKAQRWRVYQATIAFFAIWLATMALFSYAHHVGIFPVR
jgi:hypothetical protein